MTVFVESEVCVFGGGGVSIFVASCAGLAVVMFVAAAFGDVVPVCGATSVADEVVAMVALTAKATLLCSAAGSCMGALSDVMNMNPRPMAASNPALKML